MPKTDLMMAFVGMALVFAVLPGPAMLYTAAQTVARGWRAGVMAVLGINLGGMMHVVAAASGLSAIFALVPAAYLAIKLAGAAYLVWLGIQMLRGGAVPGTGIPHDPVRAFRQSVLVEVLNPKTALFFIALLPQFTDPAAAWPIWAQLLVLGTICNLLFGIADLVCVAFAGSVSAGLRRSTRAMAWARGLGGTVLIGLGVKLAAERA